MPETYSRSADFDTLVSYISGTGSTHRAYMQPSESISAIYLQLLSKKSLYAAMGIKPISATYILILGIRAIIVAYTKQSGIKLSLIVYTIHLAVYHTPITYTIPIAYI